MSTSLSVLLANEFHPPRASRVCPRLPAWLTEAMNDAYEPEILKFCGRRLRNVGEAEDFLRLLERGFGCKVFDHAGSDSDGSFVVEPYARDCAKCLAAAREFAERLG